MVKEQALNEHPVFKPRQFSTLAMLGFTTVVALILTRNSFWATILAIEIIAVYLFITSLIQNLRGGILKEMNWNCLRLDGNIDHKRAAVEQSEFRRLFWQLLLIVFILFLVPINWSLWFFRATRISPDGGHWVIGFIWLLCVYPLLKFGYLKFLRELHERIMRRHQIYWEQDILSANTNPFDD